jgi:ribosome recycling factor
MMNDLTSRMEASLNTLKNEFTGLRAGRASPSLLDNVQVEAYGSYTPLNQVANISVPEARLLTVQVWDKTMVKAVEKAISNAGLGLNPAADGALIRVPIPALSEERRKDLVKIAGKYCEQAKVSVRNVRREGMDGLKQQEKSKEISEDEHRKMSDKIQKLTDEYVGKTDEMLKQKETDILSV